jgi:hypothetical protein
MDETKVVTNGPAKVAPTQQDKQFKVDSDVRAMIVSGHTVWLAHNDGSVSIRKSRNAEVQHVFGSNQGRVWCMVATVRQGVEYVWLGLSTGVIEVYNAVSREFVTRLHRHTGGVYTLTEFGGFVYSASNDFEIIQWHVDGLCFVKQLHGHGNYVRALFVEGSLLVSGSDDRTIRVWEVASGKTIAICKFHEAGISALCRVGVTIWSADDLGKIRVWKLSSCELLDTIAAHQARVNTLKKIGSRVYSGGSDHVIAIWDCATRQEVGRIQAHAGWIMALACPAVLSRYYLWSAAADGTVRCFHHDEYTVMNHDAERFDDMRWYHTQNGPYKELNDSLIEQLKKLESSVEVLQKDYTVNTAIMQEETRGNMMSQMKAKELEASLLAATVRADEALKMLQVVQEKQQAREAELSTLSARNTALTLQNSELRCEVERLKRQAEETNRRADAALAEKQAADATIVELMQLKASSSGVPPVIISNGVDSAQSILQLHKDVVDVCVMNESLREELMRYKAVLGVRTNTDVPSLSFGRRTEGIVAKLLEPNPAPQQASAPTGGPAAVIAAKFGTAPAAASTMMSSTVAAVPAKVPVPAPVPVPVPVPATVPTVTSAASPQPVLSKVPVPSAIPVAVPTAAAVVVAQPAMAKVPVLSPSPAPPVPAPLPASTPVPTVTSAASPQPVLSKVPVPSAIPVAAPSAPVPAAASSSAAQKLPAPASPAAPALTQQAAYPPLTQPQPPAPMALAGPIPFPSPLAGQTQTPLPQQLAAVPPPLVSPAGGFMAAPPGLSRNTPTFFTSSSSAVVAVTASPEAKISFDDGYLYRGAHWTNVNVGSYVQERYFKSPVLFDRFAKMTSSVRMPQQPSPRQEPRRPMSARAPSRR